MLTLASLSLSGGQGKTTVAVLLSMYLARAGYTVLVVDADPQSNLTTFLQHEVAADQPTLLELYRKQVSLEDATYPTATKNLFLIPSDDGLDQVQYHYHHQHRLLHLQFVCFDFCFYFYFYHS